MHVQDVVAAGGERTAELNLEGVPGEVVDEYADGTSALRVDGLGG